VPTADAGDAAAPPPPLPVSGAPAGRGGFRHSRPLGSYGSRKPGGNVGRAGVGGRALVGPGVAGVAGAGTTPVAASVADGLARGAAGETSMLSASGRVGGPADRAPPGISGGTAGNGSVSAERDVVLWDPVDDGGSAVGALGVRRAAGVGGADDDGHGRNGGAGTGTAGPPVSVGASRRRGAPGRHARRGVRVAAAGGRGRRQPTGRHAVVAARCARNGHSPSSVVIASGDFMCKEGIICIGWRLPGSIPNRGIEPGRRFPPF